MIHRINTAGRKTQKHTLILITSSLRGLQDLFSLYAISLLTLLMIVDQNEPQI